MNARAKRGIIGWGGGGGGGVVGQPFVQFCVGASRHLLFVVCFRLICSTLFLFFVCFMCFPPLSIRLSVLYAYRIVRALHDNLTT